MEMNKFFKNEVKEIREMIDNISPVNFIEVYYNFIDGCDRKNIKSIELEFFNKLRQSEREVIETVMTKHYKSMDKGSLISSLVSNGMDGYYSYDSICDISDYVYFVSNFATDKEFYDVVVKKMRSIIDDIVAKSEMDSKDKARVKMETDYNLAIARVAELKKKLEEEEINIELFKKEIEKVGSK